MWSIVIYLLSMAASSLSSRVIVLILLISLVFIDKMGLLEKNCAMYSPRFKYHSAVWASDSKTDVTYYNSTPN